MATYRRLTRTRKAKEDGIALVLVLMISMILSVVSAGIIFTVQTDTGISSNYKYANEAFHVADAGVQRALDFFNNDYNAHLPVSDYNNTTSPVQYPNTGGQAVLLAGQSGSTSNYPDSATVSDFTNDLSNQTITADSNNAGTYSVNATLIRARRINTLFGTPAAMERWSLDVVGSWGTNNPPLATNRITASLENDGSPYFNSALWGRDHVNMTGNASTDSYDPAKGPYGGANVGSKGSIGTNGSISLGGNGTIHGDASYLPPGACSGCVSGSNVTGSVNVLSQPKSFPPIPPFTVGTTDVSGTTTINPGAYRDITVGNQVTLTLNAGTYYINSLSVSPNGTVLVNGPVTLYVQSGLSSGAGQYAVNSGGDPKNLLIFYNGTTDVSLTGQADFSGVVYSPNAGIKIAGNGSFFGSYIGKSVDMIGNGAIHYSEGLLNDLFTLMPFHLVTWARGNA